MHTSLLTTPRPVRRARRDFLGLIGTAALAVSCGTATGSGGRQTRRLRYQGQASKVMPAELAEDLGYLGDVKLQWVGNTISGPQDIQSTASGQIDFGGAFNGAIVKLAAAKAPIKSLVSYYGSDKYAYLGYYSLAGGPLRSARDLIGKKVGMNTVGAHAEAMLDTYLEKNGLTAKEAEAVERVVVPPVNLEQSLRQRQIDVAALEGILRDKLLANGGTRELFKDVDLFGSFSAGTYVMTERFIRANPDTVRTFVSGVGKAIEWSRATPREEVIDRMVAIVRKRGRREDTTPLQYWKGYGIAGIAGRISPGDFSLWVDWLAEHGEIDKGDVEVPDLYTNEFNDYRAGS